MLQKTHIWIFSYWNFSFWNFSYWNLNILNIVLRKSIITSKPTNWGNKVNLGSEQQAERFCKDPGHCEQIPTEKEKQKADVTTRGTRLKVNIQYLMLLLRVHLIWHSITVAPFFYLSSPPKWFIQITETYMIKCQLFF